MAYSRSLMEDDDDELDNIEQPNTPQVEISPEEQTWKKRYGDLRRLQQKTEQDVKSLRQQVEHASKTHLQLPNADDESALDEWMSTYPDIARVVSTLATRQAKTLMSQVDEKVKRFEEDKKQDEIAVAQREISRIHPDFFTEIRVDPEFIAWLGGKSKRIQDAMWSDEAVTDWQTAADVITLYKTEAGIGRPEKKDTRRDAAREVPVRSRPTPTVTTGHVFTESEIKAMPEWEYDRKEEDINKALRENKVLFDITGGTR